MSERARGGKQGERERERKRGRGSATSEGKK